MLAKNLQKICQKRDNIYYDVRLKCKSFTRDWFFLPLQWLLMEILLQFRFGIINV